MENQPINVNMRRANEQRVFPERSMRLSEMPRQMEGADAIVSPKKDKTGIANMLDKVIGFSIFVIFFGFPLFFTGLTSQGIIFEKQLYFYFWLLLGLVAWAAKGVIMGEMKIRRTPLDWPILGFWLVYAASTVFSIDRWHSFWGAFSDPSRGLMSITAYLIAYYLIVSNFNLKRLKIILIAVLTSGTIITLWTLLGILGIKFMPNAIAKYAPLSLLGSMSDLGILFALMVPIIATVIVKMGKSEGMKNISKKILIGALSVVMVLDLILILALYNYVPWAGFFAGVVIFVVFILAKIMRPKESWIWLPMVVFVLVMIVRMIGNVPIARVNLPVEVSLNYQISTDIAKSSLKSKPLLGSGPATYGYDFSLNRPKDFNLNNFYNLRFSQGSGLFMEAMPTAGILGTILFVVLMLTYVGSQFYLLAKDKEKNKVYSLGIFSGAAVLLTAFLSLRTDGTIMGITAIFIALAMAAVLYESETEGNYLNLSLKTSPKFALALAFVFMVVSAGVAFLFVFLGKVYAADFYAGRASQNLATNYDNALIYMGRAITFNQYEPQYFVQLGQFYMTLANQEALKNKDQRDVNKIQQYLNFSIQSAVQAYNMNKNDVGIAENLALIYENAGLYVPDSLTLAQKSYQQAQALEPHNPVYYLKLGQISVSLAGSKAANDQEGRKQLITDAQGLFQKAVDEKDNYAEGHYQLALADEALNQLDQAIGEGTKAAQLDSQNPNYLLFLGRVYQERNKNDDMKTAEQFYQAVVALNDKDVNGHFYLGMFYEKNNRKTDAENEYNKVISLLQQGQGNQAVIDQLNKMISNVEKGIANTPQSLGLAQDNSQTAPAQPSAQPANNPTQPIDQTQPAARAGQ